MFSRLRLAALTLAGATVAFALTPAATPGSGPMLEAAAATTPNVIYLTFDDGPNRTYTPQVLRVLAKHKAKATFFLIGQNASANPSLISQTRAAGHTIGNHSVTHPKLTAVSASRLRYEVTRGPRSRCFRPPYGATNARVRYEIQRAGMRQIMWHVDTRDWSRPGTSVITQRILSSARPGAIILMHDGGGNRSQTVAALDRALPALKARGYTFRAMSC